MNSCVVEVRRHQLGIEEKTAVVISTFSNDYFSLAVSVTHSFSSRVSKTGKFRYIIIVQYIVQYGTIAYYLEDIYSNL